MATALLFLCAVAVAASGETPPAIASKPGPIVERHADGTLSIDAVARPLDELVRRVGTAAGIEVHIDAPLRQSTTVRLQGVTTTDLVAALLSDHNYVLRAGAELWVPATEATVAERCGSTPSIDDADACGPTLADPLDDDDERLRLRAVEALIDGGTPTPSDLDRLAERAVVDPSPAVREEAIYGLSQLGEAALSALEATLDDPVARVRAAGLEAITDVGGDDAAWALAGLLERSSTADREAAVEALEEIDTEVARLLLARVLADADPALRRLAAEILDEPGADDR